MVQNNNCSKSSLRKCGNDSASAGCHVVNKKCVSRRSKSKSKSKVTGSCSDFDGSKMGTQTSCESNTDLKTMRNCKWHPSKKHPSK